MANLRPAIALLLCVALLSRTAWCGEDQAALEKEAEAIKAELDALKDELAKSKQSRNTTSKVDQALEKKNDGRVKTADGKLQIGGLVQVWFAAYQKDNRGLFDDPANGILDTNVANDNSSFEVRRAQLSFTLKANAYVTAYMMIDPAAENNTFPLVTDNQAIGGSIFKRNNNVAPQIDVNAVGGVAGLGNFLPIQNIQGGLGTPNRMLQDAYINFHNDPGCPGDFDWHHDFQVGLFLPPFGEEGLRSDAQLDFVERSFIGYATNYRDIGAQIHGFWWNDRFQYWAGAFNGAQDYFASNGDGGNRSDTNDSKDIALRMLVRPLASECWGDMEIGVSSEFGYHGETGVNDPIADPINGLERRKTWAMRNDAWGYYAPGGCFKGLWARGEWAMFRDRNAPGTVVDFTGNGGTDFANTFSGSGLAQSNARTISVQGWYAAAGYRFTKGVWEGVPKRLEPVEVAFRYQTFQNVLTADLIDPTKTDRFYTAVYTTGINYYIQEHNAKIQANYNFVSNPEDHAAGGQRNFHHVKNDSFVIAFQVGF
ncbi:MAG TPA: hypothetical protein VKX17_18705 [Planctomycetota bacterium]|nr:hypothetical protein [Planctomycetota bacterium]